MHIDNAPIGSPCTADWDAMAGDDRRRFCGQCNKHVHDLSAMREREAEALLATASGSGAKICIRYTAKADGKLRHRPARRVQLLAMGAALLSGVQAFASAAPAPAPGPDAAPGVIERVVRRIAAWAEGDDLVQATIPEATQPAPTTATTPAPTTEPELELERATMGDYAPPPPPPTPLPPPPAPQTPARPRIAPATPALPLPAVAPGQTVIPEVEAALRAEE